jgi:DNA-binding NarL/FixJ family response regulator
MNEAPRVLIVEDQYFVAIDCEHHLRAAGFDCVGFATTGSGAVELAEREHPDVILMDIRLLDDIDGVQAAIRIYEHLGIRSIFSSGHADARVRRDAERAHPFGWLDKPFTADALVRAAREAVAQLRTAAPARISDVQTSSPSTH